MRNILQNLVVLLIFTSSVNSILAQNKYGGLALYTVRDSMAADPMGTLKTIADIGYEYVEAAGYKNGEYYKMAPLAFKKYLKEIGLKPISTHQSDITIDNADRMFADAKAAGFKYFVVPIPPMGLFKYDNATQSMGMSGSADNLAKILDVLGEKCKRAGLQLLYHNHDFEFMKNENGIVPIDYLLENCNPKYVNFQMDLYWVSKAGADPITYFKKYPNRFKIWHVKDMDDQGRFAPVGQGTIDFMKILAQRKLSGMKYYMVEQDQTFNIGPLEAIRTSHKGLKEIGFQ